ARRVGPPSDLDDTGHCLSGPAAVRSALAWAEDRAPWRHDLSADPTDRAADGGALTARELWLGTDAPHQAREFMGMDQARRRGGTKPPCLCLRDWYESGISSPSAHKFSPPYLTTPVSPFHAEPLHLRHSYSADGLEADVRARSNP